MRSCMSSSPAYRVYDHTQSRPIPGWVAAPEKRDRFRVMLFEGLYWQEPQHVTLFSLISRWRLIAMRRTSGR